ncbi:MAG: hypothetical protein RL532_825 [Actinomycetota bacterium]
MLRRFLWRVLQVGDDDLGAFLGEQAGCGGTDATRAAGDDCTGVGEFHGGER